MSTLYDRDFYEWTADTAAALRAGREVDTEHLADEIEDMGRRYLHELESRLAQILEHKLKLYLVQGPVLDINQRGWRGSILRQQAEIRRLLKSSPSLHPRIPELLPEIYADAVRVVSIGYDLTPPAECPWTPEEILQ